MTLRRALSTRRGHRVTSQSVSFQFDGREYTAQAGDTVASALLAHGVRLFGRSVKYRRPRGVFAAGPEEPNALLTVGTQPCVIPNVSAPQLAITPQLITRSQNRWPSVRVDLHALLQAGSGFLGAGFYYKTFMWPSWRTYETMIRHLAGLGEAPGAADIAPPHVEYVSCDVLVGGAGAAGLAAALAAARAGARVVVCEREPQAGGELEFETATIDEQSATEWVSSALAELARAGARVLYHTAIVGGSDGLVIAHAEPGGGAKDNTVYRIRPQKFVMAMGAVERGIAFVDNDRPGVMLLGAAERYLARYGVAVGKELVLFGNHDRLYASAQRLHAAGMRIRAIIDTRGDVSAVTIGLRARLTGMGVECLGGHAVAEVHGAHGVRRICVVDLQAPGTKIFIECDALLVSGGWTPMLQAALHDGGQREFAAQAGGFVANAQPEWRTAVGACAGTFELSVLLTESFRAAAQLSQSVGAMGVVGRAPVGRGDTAPQLQAFWRSACTRAQEKRQFVDLQNDVTVADLRLALSEGFVDIEHIKRYTTLGIGTEQGRTGGLLGAAIVAELKGEPLSRVGVSRTRPPYQPMTLSSLAGLNQGDALRVTRRTPLHAWNQANGAVFEPAEYWLRTRYYRANGTDAFTAGIQEATQVRAHGGILDGSTLGKIEIAGADAAAFLDRLYLTKASTMKVGRSKYMVNLREDGMVLDDGIVLRLAPNRFLATTGSGHAEHMLSHFEHYRALEWSHRQVAITNLTEAWAVIVVAGPESRAALIRVLGEAWHARLSGLTHMDFSVSRWNGQTLRVLRASFSGELAFELHCQHGIAVLLWEALVAAGLQPYGLEALDILRVEKGYLVSSEMNGEATPQDLGMDGLVNLGNECVGRAMLGRPAFAEPQRPRLVGLRACDGKSVIQGGAQITLTTTDTHALGHVSSSVYSPALGQWIALAFVARDRAAPGTVLVARDPLRGTDVDVVVTSPVHVDPSSERMKA